MAVNSVHLLNACYPDYLHKADKHAKRKVYIYSIISGIPAIKLIKKTARHPLLAALIAVGGLTAAIVNYIRHVELKHKLEDLERITHNPRRQIYLGLDKKA